MMVMLTILAVLLMMVLSLCDNHEGLNNSDDMFYQWCTVVLQMILLVVEVLVMTWASLSVMELFLGGDVDGAFNKGDDGTCCQSCIAV